MNILSRLCVKNLGLQHRATDFHKSLILRTKFTFQNDKLKTTTGIERITFKGSELQLTNLEYNSI